MPMYPLSSVTRSRLTVDLAKTDFNSSLKAEVYSRVVKCFRSRRGPGPLPVNSHRAMSRPSKEVPDIRPMIVRLGLQAISKSLVILGFMVLGRLVPCYRLAEGGPEVRGFAPEDPD